MLNEWHSTDAHLSSHIHSGRLGFSLVCGVDFQQKQELDVAKRATASLRLLSLLKAFHIRLCKSPHHRLQEMAHYAARKARRLAAPYCRPSRYSPPSLVFLESCGSAFSNTLILPRHGRRQPLRRSKTIWAAVRWCQTGENVNTVLNFTRRHGRRRDGRFLRPFIVMMQCLLALLVGL